MKPIPPVRLLVGLGNPGNEYTETRHNAGIWLIEALLRRYPPPVPLCMETKFKGLAGQMTIGSQAIRILVPTTFMNLSGQSVAAMANFYKIEPESILIAHDELDINPGTVRLKSGGGHGGHNGLRDIIEQLGNQKQFGRLRIGIGHPGNAKQVSNFVLKKPPSTEAKLIDEAIEEAVQHIEHIVKGEWQTAMNDLHRFDANETSV